MGDSFFGGVLSSVLSSALAHPFLGLLVVLLVAATVAEKRRGRGPKDPVRRFSRVDKAQILARAGNRCESHGMLGRCPVRTGLEADHVHPHSRGGWTAIENGQALCRRHNKLKWASVPTNGQLRRLAARRAGYFPPGVPTDVIRRRPRGIPPARASVRPVPVPVVPRSLPRARPHRAPAVDAQQVRRFDPPRIVEVDVEGSWLPAVQKAWLGDGTRGWLAEVAWFQGYGPDGGRREATVPADRVRLPTN